MLFSLDCRVARDAVGDLRAPLETQLVQEPDHRVLVPAWLGHIQPGAMSQRSRQDHMLGGQELLDSIAATFAPEPGVLDATEWAGRVGHQAPVDTDHARLQGICHSECARKITGVHIGDEAVRCVVGDGEGLCVLDRITLDDIKDLQSDLTMVSAEDLGIASQSP
jgi:hypothetical protein